MGGDTVNSSIKVNTLLNSACTYRLLDCQNYNQYAKPMIHAKLTTISCGLWSLYIKISMERIEKHAYVHLFLALSECGEKKQAMVERFLILTSTEQHANTSSVDKLAPDFCFDTVLG